MRNPRSVIGACALGAMAVIVALPFGAVPLAQASPAAPLNAGSRVAEFDSTGATPIDVVAGADGSVWVALFGSKTVVQLDRSGNPVHSAVLAASPYSLAPDGSGGVWATERAGNAIAHVTATSAPAEFPIPTPFSYPASVYDSGELVFFAESTGHLGRMNELTGHVDELAFTGATSPVAVTGVGNQVWVVDDRGDTWVLDQNGENPVSVNLRGVKDLELTGFDAGTVRGLMTTKEGVFEFSRSATDLQSARVVGDRTEITGVAALNGATWFADAGTNSIGWVTASEQAEYAVPNADSGLFGMTVTEGRYIWSAERWSGKVVRVDTKAPDVERIGGADRYELAVNISKAGDYSGSGDRAVFVVSGETFADALSAGPIAAAHTAPVLLTTRATLPGSTKGELVRLAPQRVIVVGGPASVSQAVLDSIRAAVPSATIERVDGADRYAVSRALLTGDLARADSPTLYVANGANFPDALSSTAAAKHLASATLLVNGAAASLSADEMAVIGKFAGAGKSVKIAGGPNSVSAGIEAQIRSVATVQRLGGADRYEVSQAIVRDAFTGPTLRLVYLASGTTFPDALAGGVGAGLNDAPVLLVHPDCVPHPVVDLIGSGATRKVTLYGGPLTLNGEVEKLTACR